MTQMAYLLILYQCFQYDVNFTCKYLTSNERKPIKKMTKLAGRNPPFKDPYKIQVQLQVRLT